MHVEPYLNFNGRCAEALEFYKAAIGAKVTMLLHFKDAPAGMSSPESADKVMHASFEVGQSMLMASDGRCTGAMKFEGINLSLGCETDAQAAERFAALSAGGQVTMALTKTFFSSSFGMCMDKFGVTWMVIVNP